MPIHLPFPIRNLTPAEFDVVESLVMSCAYAAQITLGRLCDERVFENMLALLLRATGIEEVQTQVPVRVCHDQFEKVYRFDLLVQHAL